MDEASIEKPNSADANDIRMQYLSGVGKHVDGLITLLNISSVINDKEKEIV